MNKPKLISLLFILLFVFSALFFSVYPPFYRIVQFAIVLLMMFFLAEDFLVFSKTDFIFLAIIVLNLLLIPFSVQPYEHISNVIYLIIMFIMYIILKTTLDTDSYKKIFTGIFVFIICLSVLSILFQSHQFRATLGNPNLWSPFVVYGFFILLYAGIREKINKPVFFILLLILGINLKLSLSKAGYVSLAAVFIFNLLYHPRLRPPPAKKIFALLLILIPLSLGILLQFSYRYKPGPRDRIDMTRVYVWRSSYDIIREHPLGIGRGGNAFSETFHKYHTPGQKEWIHAHNLFFNEGVQGGIAGMILWIVLLALFTGKSFAASSQLPRSLLLVFFIHNFIDYLLWSEPHLIFFMLILSFVSVDDQGEKIKIPLSKNARYFIVAVIAVFIVLSLFVFTSNYYNLSKSISIAAV